MFSGHIVPTQVASPAHLHTAAVYLLQDRGHEDCSCFLSTLTGMVFCGTSCSNRHLGFRKIILLAFVLQFCLCKHKKTIL